MWKIIIMGLVQGLAEFLPISSSGHLALFRHILNLDLDGGILFDIMLHFGTLVAIFIAFWKDIKKLIVEGLCIVRDFFLNIFIFLKRFVKKSDTPYIKLVDTAYRKFVMMVIVSTIPTGILGILLGDEVERAMMTIIFPGIGLLMTSLLLMLADNTKSGTKRPNQISYGEAALVGCAQGIATFPGLSRSGTTITACLLCGFDKNFAVKYSFIMSIPAVLGAAILEVKDIGKLNVAPSLMGQYIIGTIVAAVVGYICIKTMLVVVRGKKYKYFAYYCFIVGLVAVVWNFV